MAVIASQLISTLLDYKKISRKKRLVYGFYVVVLTHIFAWVYAIVIIADFKKNKPTLDWADGGAYVRGFFVDVFCELCSSSYRESIHFWRFLRVIQQAGFADMAVLPYGHMYVILNLV